MIPLVSQLLLAHADADRLATWAENNGHAGTAAWAREEADRLAAQARKAAGK